MIDNLQGTGPPGDGVNFVHQTIATGLKLYFTVLDHASTFQTKTPVLLKVVLEHEPVPDLVGLHSLDRLGRFAHG